MTALKPPTPEGIDRRLRKAGHPRHDGRTRMTKYSPGYTTTWGRGGVVVVSWDGGAGDEHARAALAPLAATLGSAYRVEHGEIVCPAGDEELRFPCLIVTAPASPAPGKE